MKTTKTLIAALTLMTVTACGKAPTMPTISDLDTTPTDTSTPVTPEQAIQADAPPTVTPPANPADPTVLSFNYFAVTVCDALKNWNKQTQIIQMDATSSGTTYYRFAASGVSLVDKATGAANNSPTATKTKSNAGGTVCTIKIVSGQLISVQ